VMNWYCMCKKSGESIDRLVLHCEVATDLWVSVLSMWDRVGHAPMGGGAIG
jgi:hypothetical protein